MYVPILSSRGGSPVAFYHTHHGRLPRGVADQPTHPLTSPTKLPHPIHHQHSLAPAPFPYQMRSVLAPGPSPGRRACDDGSCFHLDMVAAFDGHAGCFLNHTTTGISATPHSGQGGRGSGHASPVRFQPCAHFHKYTTSIHMATKDLAVSPRWEDVISLPTGW